MSPSTHAIKPKKFSVRRGIKLNEVAIYKGDRCIGQITVYSLHSFKIIHTPSFGPSKNINCTFIGLIEEIIAMLEANSTQIDCDYIGH